jgi:hypothetical protein
MAITANNTTLTFNDATTQTTSGVTSVSAGTGISVAGGKTPTVTNTGVTSLTGAGTVSLSGSTGAITITGTGGSGTVTSVATGNGLSGGTITTTGTLTVACPTFNSVGSYCGGSVTQGQSAGSISRSSGDAISAGNGNNQLRSGVIRMNGEGFSPITVNNLSGSWRWMGATFSNGNDIFNENAFIAVACRIS